MKIEIKQKADKYTIQLIEVGKNYGTDFNRGERHFASSEAFILSSANYKLLASPRVAHFTFPEVASASAYLFDEELVYCGHTRFFLKGLAKAIIEYNDSRVQGEDKIKLDFHLKVGDKFDEELYRSFHDVINS